jgi:uncharacterized membrane protein YdjX (TVP38/TMEM64 family)
MSAIPPNANRPRSLTRHLTPLIVVVLLAGAAYVIVGHGGISFAALVRHRMAIDAFVSEHRVLAVLAYIALYIVAVALSLPGAVFLTVTGGFLFGLLVGASAAVIGSTFGATLIFLVARTALGEPLLKRAGPRANQLAQGFRNDAFSYLLFLRLVPIFPFWLVNLAPGLLGVGFATYVATTFLGIIPGTFACALAGSGLDSVIRAQQAAHQSCLAKMGPGGQESCPYTLDPGALLTPELVAGLVALGIVALIPVAVKWFRRRPA